MPLSLDHDAAALHDFDDFDDFAQRSRRRVEGRVMATSRRVTLRAKGWVVWTVSLGLGLLGAGPRSASASRRPALHWVDVGQGAALIAVAADAVVVVDSGPSGAAEALLAGLQEHGITRIDLWIHTHFDADHVGGIARACAGLDGIAGTADDLEVRALWDRGLESAPSTGAMTSYLDRFGGRRRSVGVGERWEASGVSVEVVAKGVGDDENAKGLALRLDLGAISTLVLGDLPASEGVVAAERAGGVDVLWASHHGARNGFDPALLELGDPTAVVISAGLENTYCHPSPEVLGWLHGRTVWMTGAAGIAAQGPCPGLAGSLENGHIILGGDLVLSDDR